MCVGAHARAQSLKYINNNNPKKVIRINQNKNISFSSKWPSVWNQLPCSKHTTQYILFTSIYLLKACQIIFFPRIFIYLKLEMAFGKKNCHSKLKPFKYFRCKILQNFRNFIQNSRSFMFAKPNSFQIHFVYLTISLVERVGLPKI